MRAVLFLSLVLAFSSTLLVSSKSAHPYKSDAKGRKVAIVKIEGAIIDSEETLRQLQRFEKRKDISAFVLRINSPGGGVAPTQEIYQEILRRRQEGMVVVTSMGSVAASGGYYIASATDYIVANPGTITGSIGVVMAFPSMEKLFEKLGIDAEVVKSGKFKDLGSPVKHLTEDERELVQALVDDVYEQFVEAVVKGRRLEEKRVKEIADGSIYSGRQALKLGLVDRLGTLSDAVDEAARLAKIEGKPEVIISRAPRGLWYWLFRGSYMEEVKSRVWGITPSLQYIWKY